MQTDFLVARPSFWTGAARVLDLFGLFDRYNISRTPFEADARALYSDWSIIGQDIRQAMEGTPYQQQKLFDAAEGT